MGKLWKIGSSVIKTENRFKKAIAGYSENSNITYEILETIESGTVGDYNAKLNDDRKKNDRDIQLKTLFNELTDKEESIYKFIDLYKKYNEDVYLVKLPDRYSYEYHDVKYKRIRLVTSITKELEKNKYDAKEIGKIITDHKGHFVKISKDLNWHVLLLKCHNFMSYKLYSSDTSLSDYYDIFKDAKEFIKQERKAKKKNGK